MARRRATSTLTSPSRPAPGIGYPRIGADFNHPKKEDFGRVMEVLAGKAAATGQASAVIEKHKAEMLALVSRLND